VYAREWFFHLVLVLLLLVDLTVHGLVHLGVHLLGDGRRPVHDPPLRVGWQALDELVYISIYRL